MTPSSRVRLIDVASAAGVSKSTASRALLGTERVSPETTARVREHADRLGYVRDFRAAELASNKGGSIGLLVRGAHLSYYGEIAVAAQIAIERAGHELLIVNGLGGADEHFTRVKTLRERGVKAAIIASSRIPLELIEPIAQEIPVVACGWSESDSSIGSIREPDTGVETLVNMAVALGHQKVAVITAPKHISRTLHYRSTLSARLLRQAKVEVIEVPLDAATDRPSASALDHALGLVTLVMAFNDPCAISVWEHCLQRGLKIPEDISLTGYDGVGQLSTPVLGLTTWRQPIEEIGARAARQVLRRLEEPTAKASTEYITGHAIIGRTLSAPLPSRSNHV